MKRLIIKSGMVLVITAGMAAKVQRQSLIIGNWCLTKNQINYPEINFGKDAIAILKSRADTVYSYRFLVQNNILAIVISQSETRKSKILKLTADSLILESLLEHKGKQVYTRCK